MECSDALILISGHIDNQNTPQEEAALQAHLTVCPDCRRVLEAYESINSGVSELRVPAPEALSGAVMSRIRAEQPKKKKPSPWLSIGTSAGLVAAVLVLLIGTKTIKLPSNSTSKKSYREDSGVFATDAPGAVLDETPSLSSALLQEGITRTEAPAEAIETDAPMAQDTEVSGDSKPVGLTAQLEQDSKALSEKSGCAVLLCDGFGPDFFDWLKTTAPALAEQFAARDAEVDDEAGTVTVKVPYVAVAALQEWFCRVFSAQKGTDTAAQLQQVLSDLGLDEDSLAKIFTFPENFTVDAWPENWPEDFAEKWLAHENWRLFNPTENYIPADGDSAYLIMLPPVAENEP